MKRILISLLLAGAATAVAQDDSGTYDVTCDGVVVGEATVSGTDADVVWHGDVQCESPYAVDELDATLHFDADGSITVVTGTTVPEVPEVPEEDSEPVDDGSVDDEEPIDGDDGAEGDDGEDADAGGEEDGDEAGKDDGDAYADDDGAEEKLTGLDRADQVAGENGAHGRDRARAAQGLGDAADGDDEKDDADDKDGEKDGDEEKDGDAEQDEEDGEHAGDAEGDDEEKDDDEEETEAEVDVDIDLDDAVDVEGKGRFGRR